MGKWPGIKDIFSLIKSTRKAQAAALLMLLIAFPVVYYLSQHQQTINQHAATTTVTFTPAIITFSSPEIGNPMRGPEYYGGEAPPPNWPLVQYSHRW